MPPLDEALGQMLDRVAAEASRLLDDHAAYLAEASAKQAERATAKWLEARSAAERTTYMSREQATATRVDKS
jgi:hypothetical protein